VSWDISEGPRSARGGEQKATVWEWELHHRYQPEEGIVRIVIDPEVQWSPDASPESKRAALSRGRTAIEKFRRGRRLPALIRVTVHGLTAEGIAR
jgi:hypothetical protein